MRFPDLLHYHTDISRSMHHRMSLREKYLWLFAANRWQDLIRSVCSRGLARRRPGLGMSALLRVPGGRSIKLFSEASTASIRHSFDRLCPSAYLVFENRSSVP